MGDYKKFNQTILSFHLSKYDKSVLSKEKNFLNNNKYLISTGLA